jgi:ELWxxDGT repeat protein
MTGSVVFALNGVAILNGLSRTDGTAAGSYVLHDRLHTATNPPEGAILGDLLLFGASDDRSSNPADGILGYELWRTDSTREGTFLLADLIPGPESSPFGPTGFVPLAGSILFGNGTDLWRTDGTTTGTVIVAQVEKGPSTMLVNTLLFVGQDAQSRVGLWRTDGTAEGTVLVQALDAPVQGGTSFYGWRDRFGLATLGEKAILVASSKEEAPAISEFDTDVPRVGPPIDAIWVSDGTPTGTRLISELQQSQGQSASPAPFVAGGYAFFVSSSGGQVPEYYTLWRTDGTEAGTIPLAPVWTGYLGSSSVLAATIAGNRVFFSTGTPDTGIEMWLTDGTAAGTGMVLDIQPGPGSSLNKSGRARNDIWIGGQLLFEADDGVHGTELWVSDGTAAGTHILADIRLGSTGSFPSDRIEMNGAAYFTAAAASGDVALWRYIPSP